MQGDVLAPLLSSLKVDTMGKECIMEDKHMYYYKGIVPIPPLGMVDDLFTISICGYKTNLMNIYINTKTAMKKLQFGTSKCVKMHVGRTCNQILCNDLFVDGWKVQVISDDETVTEQMYLGDIISAELLSCPGLAEQDNEEKKL